MASKKEKEEMAKALKGIDNKWDALAYIWTYRQKEFKNVVITVESITIVALLLVYTPIASLILTWIKGVIK